MRIDESKLRRWEVYSEETIRAPVIVRIDGKNFHRVTRECGMKRPFDERFHRGMVKASEKIMTETGLNISLAYAMSDEASFLFLKDEYLPFRGRIEKIISIIPSYASAYIQNFLRRNFSYKRLVSFDARIVKVQSLLEIVEYFSWRCSEAFRNFLNSYAQRIIGSKEAYGLKGKDIIEKLSLKGFDIRKAEEWQKYGTVIYWGKIKKDGFNPITSEKVTVRRRRIHIASFDITSVHGREKIEEIISNYN